MKSPSKQFATLLLVLFSVIVTPAVLADEPIHSAFTYQGQLRHNGEPVTESVSMTYRLYDDATGGEQVGPELTGAVTFDGEGRFTIDLAFGADVFDGGPLWLEIEVGGTVLSPRQPLMPTPYAFRALNVAALDDSAFGGTYSNAVSLTHPGNSFTGSFSGSFSGGGAALTDLSASNISTGNLSMAHMPTGGTWSLPGWMSIADTLLVEPVNKRVGIGTPLGLEPWPAAMLHVIGPEALAATLTSNSTIGTWFNLHNASEGGRYWRLISTGKDNGEGAGKLLIGYGPEPGSHDASAMSLTTSGVGIGTDWPMDRLHVVGEHNAPGCRVTAEAQGSGFAGFRPRNSLGEYFMGIVENRWMVFDNKAQGERITVTSSGKVGIGTSSPSVDLAIGDDGTGLHRPIPNAIALHTGGDERMRIASNGDAGIGESSIPTANTARRRLHVRGHGGSGVNGIRLTHGGSLVNWDLLIGGSANSFPDGLAIAYEGSATTGLVIRSSGNVGLGTSTPSHPLHMASGAHCTAGGTWTNASSRELKENFQTVDTRAVLETLATLPIFRWNYKSEDASNVHMGPTAEDFAAAFGLGDDSTSIATVDADGVLFAAVQALHQTVQEKDARLAAQRFEISSLRDEVAELRAAVAHLLHQQEGNKR